MATGEDASGLQAPDEEPLGPGAVRQEALGRRPGQRRLLARGERTDGVHERPPRFERGERALEDPRLQPGRLRDPLRRRAPPYVGPGLEGPEPGARRVEEHAV